MYVLAGVIPEPHFQHDYFFVLLITGVVIYDCLLTLPSEIALFWRWEFSGAAALFFATRYFALWELGIASVLPQTIFVSLNNSYWPYTMFTRIHNPRTLHGATCFLWPRNCASHARTSKSLLSGEIAWEAIEVLQYIPYARMC